MNHIDKLVDYCEEQLSKNADRIRELTRVERIFSAQIENSDEFRDDDGNSPTGVTAPVHAELHKDELLNELKDVVATCTELQKRQTQLLTMLVSLTNGKGGRKNKTVKKRRHKKRL